MKRKPKSTGDKTPADISRYFAALGRRSGAARRRTAHTAHPPAPGSATLAQSEPRSNADSFRELTKSST